MCSRADVDGSIVRRNMGRPRRSTIASTAGVRREFGRASSRRRPNLLNRRNEWLSTARMSKRIAELLGDKAYESNSFRKSLRKDGIKPVIPGRSNRKKRIRHDKQAYKDRNVIERCYCRLKDFRRIATCYDKLARNYFSALCLVAAVAFWL